jgi:two-component system chemotaxis response regulator CheY
MTDVERAAAPSRRRILVVDDSALVRLYYRDTLQKAGFEVEQAINGIEAMEKVLAQPFDLAIVDVNMPRMDGFSFLRTLRRSAADVATLPALVITTEAGEQDLDAARAAGANFYLIKPVSQQDLLRRGRPLGSAGVIALHEQFIAEARG